MDPFGDFRKIVNGRWKKEIQPEKEVQRKYNVEQRKDPDLEELLALFREHPEGLHSIDIMIELDWYDPKGLRDLLREARELGLISGTKVMKANESAIKG